MKITLRLFSVTILLFFLIAIIPLNLQAQISISPNSATTINKNLLLSSLKMYPSLVNINPDATGSKESRCLQSGRWIGAIAGSTMGLLHIYWRARGVSGIHGPFWKSVVTGIPSAIVGAYIGMKTTEWTTKQIMKGEPKPGKAALKGAFYGAIDGAITLTASLIPLLIIGHYTGSIEFNFDNNDLIILKLLGTSVLGGLAYGGTFGLAIGVVYGPCISLYMNF